MRQVRELTDLRIDEISLVDKGANQHAIVTIAKRDGAEEETMSEEYFDSDGHSVDVDDLDYGDVVFDEYGNGYEVADGDDYDDVEKAAGALAIPANVVGKPLSRMGRAGVRARQAGAQVRDHVGRNKMAYGAGGAGLAGGYGLGRIQKADDVRANTGGRAGAVFGGPVGSAIQAKDGRRLRAAGNTWGGGLLGQAAGTAAGGLAGGIAGAGAGALTRDPAKMLAGAGIGAGVGGYAGGSAGGIYGAIKGADRAAQKGHLKDKWVQKSYGEELREEFSKALSDNDRDEVISKALDYIDAANENAEAAYYAAEMERDARLEAEFTEVAKSYSVGIEPEVLGPVLKRMTEVMDEDDVDVIVTALSTASDVVEKSFEEYGSAGLGDHSDVLYAVDSMVEGMVSKGGGGFSREEAVTGIFEENPEAYDEYLAERRYL